MLSDNDLLDFDASTLARADAGDARLLLREHGDVFRAQLVTARWLEGYLRRRQESHGARPAGPSNHSADHEDGFEEGMRDVIAHLRQGDFLPGGALYEDEQKRD
jgi:hypothetical protein